jgi:hypothetical protein
MQIDAAAKADQIETEKSRIEAQKEIAAMQVGATAAAARDKLAKQTEAEGVRMGIDAAKHRAQMSMQQRQMYNKQPRKE